MGRRRLASPRQSVCMQRALRRRHRSDLAAATFLICSPYCILHPGMCNACTWSQQRSVRCKHCCACPMPAPAELLCTPKRTRSGLALVSLLILWSDPSFSASQKGAAPAKGECWPAGLSACRLAADKMHVMRHIVMSNFQVLRRFPVLCSSARLLAHDASPPHFLAQVKSMYVNALRHACMP